MLLFLVLFVLTFVVFALVLYEHFLFFLLYSPLKDKHFEFRGRCLARLQGVAQQEVEATVAHTSTLKLGHFMFVQNEEEREKTCVGAVHDRVLKYKHLLVGLRDLWTLTRAY